MWVDRKGREAPLKTPPRAYVYPRLSPDGTRVALDIRDQENDIWIWNLARETLTRLTFGPALEFYGIWTPDSQAVIFSSGEFGGNIGRRSLFRRAADGTGPVEELTQGAGSSTRGDAERHGPHLWAGAGTCRRAHAISCCCRWQATAAHSRLCRRPMTS